MTGREDIALEVNGRKHELTVEPRELLSDVLRHRLNLTGTHVGCEQGVCGACTVSVNGLPMRACLMLAVQADGAVVRTVEGLSDGDALHPLQETLSECYGLQCGFCTPGFLMLATSYLEMQQPTNEAEVVEVMSANLCRCTGYAGLIDAVCRVAQVPGWTPSEEEQWIAGAGDPV
jgi:Aerobic-type carbon monoxide dehydrogenase, small subunit CoxS/CutS homologs